LALVFFSFLSGDFEEGGKKERAKSDDRIKTKYRQAWKPSPKPINKYSKKKERVRRN